LRWANNGLMRCNKHQAGFSPPSFLGTCPSRVPSSQNRRHPGMPTRISLRQPGFPQSLLVSREVFQPAKRDHTPEIGNPERWIDLAEPRRGLLCWIESPGEGMACCCHARRVSRSWLLAAPLLRPRRRFVRAASVEMAVANVSKGEGCERIKWAAEGTSCPIDCNRGLAQEAVDPAAQKPSRG